MGLLGQSSHTYIIIKQLYWLNTIHSIECDCIFPLISMFCQLDVAMHRAIAMCQTIVALPSPS